MRTYVLHLQAILTSLVLLMYYYLMPWFGINQYTFWLIAFAVFFAQYISRLKGGFKNVLISMFLVYLIATSLLLYLLNLSSYTAPFFNDIIRLFYFSLFLQVFYKLGVAEQKRLLHLIANYSFLLALPALIIEYLFPKAFYFFYFELMDASKEMVVRTRMASFIGDSNSLAFVLAIIFYLQLNTKRGKVLKFSILSALTFFIFCTGSRMGLLMLAVLLIRYFGFWRVMFMTLISLFVFYCSSFDAQLRENSSASDTARLNSILDALEFISFKTFFYPMGNVFFKNNYRIFSDASHFPHFGFLYNLIEYGIFALGLFIIQAHMLLSVYVKDRVSFIILLMSLLFLPNQIYYMGFYLLFSASMTFYKIKKAL